MRRGWLLAILFSASVALAEEPRPDLLIGDFEGDHYGDWSATGEAFGPGPAGGTLPGQMHVSGYQGRKLVNTFLRGDQTTGTLTSPVFKLERPWLNFLIGGGHHPDKTCMNLLIGDKVVRSETGPDVDNGGSERLDWKSWDVREFQGQQATLQIVDQVTGGWGHINVDQIFQSDLKREPEPVRQVLKLKQRYLQLPVNYTAPTQRLRLSVSGKTIREFTIELATQKPDFYIYADLQHWQEQELSIEVPRVSGAEEPLRFALSRLEQLAEQPPEARSYEEQHRPLFHFTARRGWLNDPNGMVYHDGKYHLYFQHNPYGWNWGNMHWGHAVSTDLTHWEEQPIALYPRQFGDWCFSGSAVVDHDNTSGFRQGDKPPLVAAFTSTGRGECIVYSNDGGQTWTEYEGNPVVRHQGRDPRLLWHKQSEQWVMAVYTEADQRQWIAFHTSPDLKTWTYQSRIPDFFECPDLFELKIRDTEETRWILLGADAKYLIGQFDGKQFLPDSPHKQQVWYGPYYASQTFTNHPQGKVIQMGWERIDFPGMPFNQQMSIPVELDLVKRPEGLRLLAGTEPTLAALKLLTPRLARFVQLDNQAKTQQEALGVEAFYGRVILEPRQATQGQVIIRGQPLSWDGEKQTLTIGNITVPAMLRDDQNLSLEFFVDRNSLEVFVNKGEAAIVVPGRLPADKPAVQFLGGPGGVSFTTTDIYEIPSTWKKPD